MQKTLSADLTRVSKDRVKFEITKNNYEAFCNAVGLYKEEFLEALKRSEADHKAGRITKRKPFQPHTQNRKTPSKRT